MKALLDFWMLIRAPRPATFMATRVDRLMGRSYSIALLASGVEMSINAFAQYPYLNPWLFWLCYLLVFGGQIYIFISQWFFLGSSTAFAIHAGAVLFCLVVQPWLVTDFNNLPPDFTPWVWWSLGVGAVSAGFALKVWASAFYIFLVPMVWVLIRVTEYGGETTPMHAVQDATYTFLFSAVFTALPQLLRYQAKETDQANQLASENIAKQAYTDAAERELVKASALVHDNVLNTLELAATATTAEQRKNATDAAKAAIESLAQYRRYQKADSESVSAESLFSALTQAIEAKSPGFAVSVELRGELSVPANVASAVTHATIQAVENSVLHAGDCSRRAKLRATSQGIKVVVVDDGVGFRYTQAAKGKLGLKLAVIARMNEVGGEVHIDAAPNQGSTVVIEWSGNE